MGDNKQICPGQENGVRMDKEMLAVVFPGQGAQRMGMGKDFYEQIAGMPRSL